MRLQEAGGRRPAVRCWGGGRGRGKRGAQRTGGGAGQPGRLHNRTAQRYRDAGTEDPLQQGNRLHNFDIKSLSPQTF